MGVQSKRISSPCLGLKRTRRSSKMERHSGLDRNRISNKKREAMKKKASVRIGPPARNLSSGDAERGKEEKAKTTPERLTWRKGRTWGPGGYSRLDSGVSELNKEKGG